MAGGGGTSYRLLGTFLKLQKTCPKYSLSLYSDCDGGLHDTLKAHIPRPGNQAPRRGGCQPRRQEAEPGIQAPSPAPPAPRAPPAPPAPTPAPAPARRARRRGPGALLCDEKRRLARIEQSILLSDTRPKAAAALSDVEVEGETALPPPPPPTLPRPPPGTQ